MSEEKLIEQLCDTWHALGLPYCALFRSPDEIERFEKKKTFISWDAMEHVMPLLGLLPCPQCTQPNEAGVETTPLLVRQVPMPLGARGNCAKAMCMVCGFSAQWAVRTNDAMVGQLSAPASVPYQAQGMATYLRTNPALVWKAP